MYPSLSFDEVRTAVTDFSVYVQDQKAAIYSQYASNGENQTITQAIFYDGPTPPPGVFENLTNIPSLSSDLKTRSYADVMLTFDAAGFRWGHFRTRCLVHLLTFSYSGSLHMLSVSHFSETLLEAVEDELKVSASFSHL